MNIFSDPVFLRGIERILLVAASAYLGYLGYRLFLYGMASGRSASNPQLQLTTAFYSGVAPALFFFCVAGAVIIIVSLTGGALIPAARPRSAPSTATRANDRAELLKQIAALKETDIARQTAIRELRNQLAQARTNNTMTEAAVDRMRQSVNAASSEVDFNALYSQMQELSDAADQLQSENDTLRTENTALRAQTSQNAQ